MDLDSLREWFLLEKRDFPWRENPTPYRVWISEVMLQQTRAEVVVGYFERWMIRFPTIAVLAAASQEEVLKQWEGLGYYARARHLHAGARFLVEHYSSALPSNAEELARIKGLGSYTIGAIRSFAFQEKAVAIDANVARVMARLYGWEEEISSTRSKAWLHTTVETLLPPGEPWVIMEAFIELGAQVCGKQPKCSLCPLQTTCLAYARGKERVLPIKRKKSPPIILKRWAYVIVYEDQVLLRRGNKGEVMADLYEFPYGEKGDLAFPLDIVLEGKLPQVKHTFTRYSVTLMPSVWRARQKKVLKGFEWKSWEEVEKLPFSSGHRRIKDAYFAHGELRGMGRSRD
jgi:A/G-specific adenine glycosylase